MIELEIPNVGRVRLRHLVLDVNGTLALDGRLLPGVAQRLARLRSSLDVHLVTANTHGTQDEIDRELGVKSVRVLPDRPDGEQKLAYLRGLGADEAVAIGNGANDVLMLREAALGICVLGPEGLASAALGAADVVVPDVNTGLDLLLNPRRLVATLRR
jgi:soluble P-type ATPase